MRIILTPFLDRRFPRYLLASVGALTVDIAIFMALLGAGLGAVPAAATGYALGILTHWFLSSRAVFIDSVAANGRRRSWQKALFVTSALLGLAITTSIVAVGEAIGVDPRLAKLVAVGASFVATWLMRRHIVFRAATVPG
ncbi:MAG: GtrA family protein [Erythrobacter sp.]|uniref:GtrA family protein n=1 Tax=Erythrobacter sp. TaxID=1042 RepID=UPI001B0BE04E|nr:GtrA family protein [Erythrobacter sp.]MBO6768878.1 GtrA family protein [Erythrobacter sp.]